MKEFIDLIKKRLFEIGMSKTDFAHKIGYKTNGYVTHVLNGKVEKPNFDHEKVNKMARITGIPIEDILKALGYRLAPSKDKLTFEQIYFLEKLNQLDAETQRKFLKSMILLLDLFEETEQKIEIDKDLENEVLDENGIPATINGKEYKIQILKTEEKTTTKRTGRKKEDLKISK